MSDAREKDKALNLLEQGELEVDSDSTLNEDDRSPSPVVKTQAQIAQLIELAASRLSFFRPSFLNVKSSKTTKLRKTAYLDGVRGFAALLVYFLHHMLWSHAFQGGTVKCENAFGFEGKYYLCALPYLRTFFTGGHYAVACFFVLSGYVLSMKPLTLIQKNDQAGLADSLASGLFRRWLRLFIPIWVITFFYACTPHIFGIHVDFKTQSNLRDELWNWYCTMKNYTFVWGDQSDPFLDYQKHSWSIPVEMRGSITIYTAVLAFSRCTKNARLTCEVLLIGYFMWIVDGSHMAMFVAGMLICDLELLAEADNLPSWMYSFEPYKQEVFYAMFFMSMTLGGIPSNSGKIEHMRETPIWRNFAWMVPQAVFDFRWFFLFWAAAFLVGSVGHIAPLKRFFESRFCQYLGRISYMFYLMHGPLLWLLGDRLYAAVGFHNFTHAVNIPGWADCFMLPKWGPFGLEFGYVVVQLFMLPLTLYVGELVTALVDDPSIKFAAFCYSLTQPRKPSREQGERKA